ncbi:MarR family transcriptional regulator [Actinomycetospora endophytica]|uniref:MarR family transcriptional regulator n=1 Tax=Actinomycetospora endophytica TaxID=2291215 RepID=A0ABS8PAI8_9PSEU|nr:MarR family transcriptional regulator [Actinomycetospora endophytica]MCD2195271.1 MarR family transcriptional regulator [Actinomycetospora endophytica]
MERLARQVRELIVASDHYRQTMAAGLRIGVTESAVLGHLLHNGPQTPSTIAARIGLTAASTTALLDRLAASQLVRRTPNPHDRRSVLVELTDLGRAAIGEMYTMFAIDIDAALDRADPRLRQETELREAITDLLERMAAALRERSGDRRGIEDALAATADRGGSETDTVDAPDPAPRPEPPAKT